MKKIQISASILSANFACLGKEVQDVLSAGADMIHIDVMDNHYVPNLTFGPLVCDSLRKAQITAPFDVHLMCKPVERLITDFAAVGATIITIHPEATEHLDRSLQLIRDAGCQAGIALNPASPLTFLDHVLDKIDLILIMSVNPGFGGQTFIPEATHKIKLVHEMLKQKNTAIKLSVDGGVKKENIKKLMQAGADTFVMGSAIFGAKDYNSVISDIRSELK